MHAFWALSNLEKLILLLKIMLVGASWVAIIIVWVVILFVFCDALHERWLKKQETTPKPGTLPPSPDPQIGIFQLRQVRRERQRERDEFFNNVQEIQNELR